MKPLTDTEKAYFDTIKQVATSPRPEHLTLRRMALVPAGRQREVAVIGQTVLDAQSGEVAGWMPLALVIDEQTSAQLVTPDGSSGEWRSAAGLEGPA